MQGQRGRGEHAVSSEISAELRQGAVEAFFGGLFRDVRLAGDFGEGEVLRVTQEEGVAVAAGKGLERGVQKSFGVGGGGRGGSGGAHGGGLLLMFLANAFKTLEIGTGVVGHLVKPSDGRRTCLDLGGILGEENKDGLRDVVGMVDKVHPPKNAVGGGVDGGEMPINELAKGIGGASCGISAKQFRVVGEAHFRSSNRHGNR